MSVRATFFAGALAASLLSAAAFAAQGFTIVDVETDLADGSTGTTTIHVTSERLALDSRRGSQHTGVVFLADQDLALMFDHNRREVREMRGKDLEQVSSQVSEAQKMMQERLKNLTPDQRAMVEKMMKGGLGGMLGQGVPRQAPAKTLYRKSGGERQVGPWTCVDYEGYRGEEKRTAVCAAEFSQFGARAEDFAIFQKLGRFMGKASPKKSGGFFEFGGADWRERQGFPGVPVERTTFRDGRPKSKSRIEKFERGEIPDEVFEKPAGYRVAQGFPGGPR